MSAFGSKLPTLRARVDRAAVRQPRSEAHAWLACLLGLGVLALLLTACADDLADPPSGAVVILVPAGATWSYLDDGSDPGDSWTTLELDDGSWAQGPALFGYGEGDEVTLLRCGAGQEVGTACPEEAEDRALTTFFRYRFEIDDPTSLNRLRLRLMKDDGAVVYLNGRELVRANVRPGNEGQGLPAAAATKHARTWLEYRFEPTFLVPGQNILAAEVHQASSVDPDLAFDLELIGFDPLRTAIARGPYLQLPTPTSARIRWRSGDRMGSGLEWRLSEAVARSVEEPGAEGESTSDDPTQLDSSADPPWQEIRRPAPKTEHSILLEDLQPSTRYCYRLVGDGRALAGVRGPSCFRTPPDVGSDSPVRIWGIGDAGTGDSKARAVKRAFRHFAEQRPADVWITFGDNAYDDGSDVQFQSALFDTFPEMLDHLALWPSLGNHDLRSVDDGQGPYFDIFDLPTGGEAGGLASETEAYYSFDYGRVHFVALDTASGDMRPGREMLTWLEADLEATSQPWLIVYFHHPPYSDGWHRTDNTKKEWRSLVVRENVLPILEEAGVDLVLAGHSHSYERSYLLHGHHGVSETLKPSMILDGGDGREDGDGAYRKKAGQRGTVYVVAGSSGKVAQGNLEHPAMAISWQELGSVVIDIDGPRLDLSFVTAAGKVGDSFTLMHE